MKKVAIRVFILLSLLTISWLGVTWWVGMKTEQFMRVMLAADSQANASHTLLSYQRSLFSAQAITRLNVKDTPLGTWADALQLRHSIQHGPLIWKQQPDVSNAAIEQKGLSGNRLLPAFSYWQTQLDSTNMDKDFEALLQTTFSKSVPFAATGLFDYQQIFKYQAVLAAFFAETETGDTVRLDGLTISGEIDTQSMDKSTATDTIFAQLDSLLLDDNLSRLQIPAATLSLQINATNTEYTLWFATEQAMLTVADNPVPLKFAAEGNTAYISIDADVGVRFNLVLDIIDSTPYSLEQADINFELQGLAADGLAEVNRQQNYLQDIQARLRWNEEEIALPEARREQLQLKLQADYAANELLQALFNQALQQNATRFKSIIRLQTDTGDLQQFADFTYTGHKPPLNINELLDFKLDNWAKLLRGKITLDTDKAILPQGVQTALDYPLETKAIIEENGRYQMDLQLTDYDIELNGRAWAFEHLADKFISGTQRGRHVPGPAVSPQVMALIGKQGLTDEVLQKLKLNPQVSADALKMLQQLHFMNKQLQ